VLEGTGVLFDGDAFDEIVNGPRDAIISPSALPIMTFISKCARCLIHLSSGYPRSTQQYGLTTLLVPSS
jgi:hypothetical protein